MKVTAEKLDDINIILSGIIDDKVTKEKVATLKKQAALAQKKEDDTPQTDESIQQQAESEVLTQFIETGLKEANIPVDSILGQPGFKKYEKRDNGLYLEIAVATSPIIDTDVEYMDIVPTFNQPDADPKEVEAKLLEMAAQQAPFSGIETPRPTQDGDVTIIDFDGFVDGVAFEGGSAEKFTLKIGSNSFIPGFEEQLIGMAYGEEKTVKVTFPEDYGSTNLAGKEAEFKVKLHEIQEQQASTPDDDFAQGVLKDKEATLDTLRAKLADQINSAALSQFYNDELKPRIIQGLLSKFDFTLPNNIVEQEIDAKVNEAIQQMSEEEIALHKKDKEKFYQLRESVTESAKNTIKSALIIEALAKKEGIEVSDAEVDSALKYEAMMRGKDADELLAYYKENNLMISAKVGLREDKLFKKILGIEV
jgi:trigger factor